MAFIDKMIAGMGHSSTMSSGMTMQGGMSIPNNAGHGGTRFGSHAAVERALEGHNQFFKQNWNSIVPWAWSAARYDHSSTNTCVEMRRMCVQIMDSNDQWQWLFKDLIPGYGIRKVRDEWNTSVYGLEDVDYSTGVVRVYPASNYTWEYWPLSTPGNPFTHYTFYGGVNRTLCAQAKSVCVSVQVRRALINPNTTDDRNNSRFVIQLGTDPHVYPKTGTRYITDGGVTTDDWKIGYPYYVMDGDHSNWELITWDDWQWIGFVTGVNLPGQVTKTVGPPWGNYSWVPDWHQSPYQITYAELLANPVLDPDTGGGSVPSPTPTPPPAPTPTPTPTPVPNPAPAVASEAAWTTVSGSVAYYDSDNVAPAPAPGGEPPPAPAPEISESNPSRPVLEIQTPKVYLTIED